MRAILTPLIVAAVGCGASLVPVTPGPPDPGTVQAASDPTFEMIARSSGVRDPLPVSGANVAYADLERALSQALMRTVRPRHELTLIVELVSAEAKFDTERVSISLVSRVTLKRREGNAFVAQTLMICRDAALVPPAQGGSVVWSCMLQLGRDLGGWLDGISP